MQRNVHSDEERIREITQSLSEIETLSRVLDGEYFKGKPITFCFDPFIKTCFRSTEIPKLFTNLNKLLINHNNNKVC